MKYFAVTVLIASALCAQTSNFPGSIDGPAQLFVTADNIQTPLTSPMLVSDTVAIVASTTGFQANMIATICDTQTTSGKCTAWEHMLVTGTSGSNILMVNRGFAGTSARAHASGLNVSVLIDSAHQKVLSSAVQAIETGLGPNLNNLRTFISVPGYNFAPQTPGGSLTGSTPATVMLTPCPQGVNGSDTNHYLYVQSVGGNEPVLINGGTCTSGAPTGTVNFTPGSSHSGAWTIQSATAGFQEAHNVAPNGSTVYFPAGSYNFEATATVTKTLNMQGDGFISAIIGTGLNYCLFHSLANGDIWQQMEMLTLTAQTSAGCGISLDATGGGTNSSATVRGVNFVNLYDDILEVNAAAGRFENNQFQNFGHTAVTIADPNCADCGGPVIKGNLCQNTGLGSAAAACFLIKSTGGIVIQGNQGNGDINQINYFVQLTATSSSGLIIDANDIENFALYSINLSGTYSRIAVTNNLISNFTGDASTWVGVLIVDGAGAGLANVVVSGNTVQGAGVSGNTCIELGTSGTGIIVGPNQINNCGNGVYAASQTGAATIEPQNMTSVTTPYVASSSTLLNNVTPVPFASLGTPAPGSQIQCTNCNSGCTAGGSTGQSCNYYNAAWAH